MVTTKKHTPAPAAVITPPKAESKEETIKLTPAEIKQQAVGPYEIVVAWLNESAKLAPRPDHKGFKEFLFEERLDALKEALK